MANCKPGKEKNSKGRCVKVTNGCKSGKEKNANGRCVNKCTTTQRRNRAGKCVSLKKPVSYSIKSPSHKKSSSHYASARQGTVYRKPLPINAAHFRGQLLTKKRHLKHHPTPHTTSTDSAFGHFNF